MNKAAPWLPPTAVGDVRTAQPVAHALAHWADEWLVRDALAASPRWKPCGAVEGGAGFSLVGHERGHRLLQLEGSALDMAGLLLGRHIDERECRTDGDRAVIEHVVQAAISALAKSLAAALPPIDEQPDSGWFALPISRDDGRTLLRLEAARPVLVALVKAWAGTPRRGAALADRQSPVAAQDVTLSARIGTSRLALAEIESLDVGDVLTLTAPLSAPIGACIDGKFAADRALTLTPGGGELKLRIERPASQW